MNDESNTDFIPSIEFVRSFQRFVGAVFRLNGQLLSTADLLSKDLEVSTARWQTIAVIRNEPLTVAEIARRLGLSRQSVQQTVNRLCEQDITEFIDNPAHKTSQLVRLTDHGKEVMETLRDRQTRLTAYFTGGLGFSVDEIDRLTDKLEHLRRHAEQIDTSEFISNTDDNG
ncbi:MAG: MarR family transcriptional regulator [Gammaproteobacteria bacterium]|nr:MarR family transcriptional regulator [Gammaproteobacteria bacterium]